MSQVAQHIEGAIDRVRVYCQDNALDGFVATKVANVAWLSAGINPAIDRSGESDSIWIAVTSDAVALITNVVEAPRLLSEHAIELEHFHLIVVPWSPQSNYVEAAREFLNVPALRTGCDSDVGFSASPGGNIADDLIALRLVHSPLAMSRLQSLGSDLVEGISDGLATFKPGELDREVQANICYQLERRGIQPVVVLVGGDERVRSFRHPIALGLPIEKYLMAVLVGRRHGLHVAVTRMVSVGAITGEELQSFASLGRIYTGVLEAAAGGVSRGMTYGELYGSLADGYEKEGHAGAWSEHFQGGPIGYGQREFEIAPTERNSWWFSQRLERGHALAFNPSLRGGIKVEETFVLGSDGFESVTPLGAWPRVKTQGENDLNIAGVLEI